MATCLRRAVSDEYAPLPDLQGLPPLAVTNEEISTARRQAAQAHYDTYFGVRRTQDQNTFAHSTLIGFHGVLDNLRSARSSLAPTQWQALATGIHDTLNFMLSARGATPYPYPPPPRAHSDPDPDQRWRLGHRAFFVLTQCIIIGLRGFLDAAQRAMWPAAVTALDYGTTMLAASAACLHFTADFRANDYSRTVRPAMPAEFTGLASADHTCLVAQLRAMGPTLQTMPSEFAQHREALRTTLRSVYLAHQGICARFDGDHNPSLRTDQHSATPATTVLSRLARSRCRLLEP